MCTNGIKERRQRLHDLLLAAPAGPRATLALDPGLRTGCKVAVVDATGANELARSGRVRPLAFTAPKRSIVLPEVPTVAEAGYPDYLAFNWVAAAASSKAPPAALEQLGALFAKAAQTPEIQAYYRKQGTELIMSSAPELRRYQAEEIERWKRLMGITGIELQ